MVLSFPKLLIDYSRKGMKFDYGDSIKWKIWRKIRDLRERSLEKKDKEKISNFERISKNEEKRCQVDKG